MLFSKKSKGERAMSWMKLGGRLQLRELEEEEEEEEGGEVEATMVAIMEEYFSSLNSRRVREVMTEIIMLYLTAHLERMELNSALISLSFVTAGDSNNVIATLKKRKEEKKRKGKERGRERESE
jgi:CBS domain containing-hemolysin-like protein